MLWGHAGHGSSNPPPNGRLARMCVALEMDCDSLISFWGWLQVLRSCFFTFSLCRYTLK